MVGLTILLGLGSRKVSRAPAWVSLYLGDVLWGVMFFGLFALVWPRRSTVALAAWAIGVSIAIELSQLYQAPWINQVRDTRIGGLLLGHAFLFSDLVCVSLGGLLGAAIDVWLLRRR